MGHRHYGKNDDTIIEVGQIWESCDYRDSKRQIEIIEEGIDSVICRNVQTGRRSTIRRSRFHETSTGYRLMKQGKQS